MSHKSFSRNILKFIVPLFVAATFTFVNQKTPVATSAWSGTQTSTAGNYYASVGNETGEALRSKLKTIISGPRTSYDWTRYEAADEAEGVSDSVLLIYSRKVVKKTYHVSGTKGWNREHTFPDSKVSGGAKSDNHNIFADDNVTNNRRGNKLFGIVAETSGNRVKDMDGDNTDNYTSGNYFMPTPAARGEVARATMYVNTLYNHAVTENFQSIALMLEWHLENPITNRDIYRNNKVHTLQGNRNPFVDHPEYACSVWGGTNDDTASLCASSVPVDVTGVTLTPKTQTLSLLGTTSLQMNATVLPNNASNKTINWTSSNSNVASISSTGTLLAKAVGTTIITATSAANNGIKDTATINVTNNPISVTGITITDQNISVNINKKVTINTQISPSNATNKNVIWQSSDPTVASITNDGEVRGLKVGSSTMTVRTVDGNKTASVVVNVVIAPTLSSATGNFRNDAGSTDGVENFTVNDLNNGKPNSYLGFGNKPVVKSFTKEKMYIPKNGGFAMGSGSASGYLNLTLNDEYATKKIDVLFGYFGNATSNIELKGATGVASTQTNGTIGTSSSDGLPYSVTFNESQTYVAISSTKRVTIVEIVIYLEVEELENPIEDAKGWSRSFLESTDYGCALSDRDELYSAWQLAEDSFHELSEEAQAVVISAAPLYNLEDDLTHARARYNVIKASYGFYDFLAGESENTHNQGNVSKPVNITPIIVISLFTALSTSTLFILRNKKRRINIK